MKNVLFPRSFQTTGWMLFIPATVMGVLNALYVYVMILIASTLLINGLEYLRFMTANLVLFPMIFVVIFRLEMRRYNKMSEDEE